MIDWIVNRLKEPSTYAGFAGLAIALGLSNEEWMAISTALAGVAGVVAMFVHEQAA